MATRLNFKSTMDGTKLTFDDGTNAGLIVYLPNISSFRYQKPDGRLGEYRRTHEAAEFDALAWAADFEYSRKHEGEVTVANESGEDSPE